MSEKDWMAQLAGFMPMLMMMMQQSQAGGSQPSLGGWNPRGAPVMPGSNLMGGGMLGPMMGMLGSMGVPGMGGLQERLQAHAGVNPMALRSQLEFQRIQTHMSTLSSGAPLVQALGMDPNSGVGKMLAQLGPQAAQMLGATGIVQALAPQSLIYGGQSLLQASMRIDGAGKASMHGYNGMDRAFKRELYGDNDTIRFDRSDGLAADSMAGLVAFAAQNGIRGEMSASERAEARRDGISSARKERIEERQRRGLSANLTATEEKEAEAAGERFVESSSLVRGARERLAPVMSALRERMPEASDSQLMQIMDGMPKAENAEQARSMGELIRKTTELAKAFGVTGEQLTQMAQTIQAQVGGGALAAEQDALQMAALERFGQNAGLSTEIRDQMTADSMGIKSAYADSAQRRMRTTIVKSGSDSEKAAHEAAVREGREGEFLDRMMASNDKRTQQLVSLNRRHSMADMDDSDKKLGARVGMDVLKRSEMEAQIRDRIKGLSPAAQARWATYSDADKARIAAGEVLESQLGQNDADLDAQKEAANLHVTRKQQMAEDEGAAKRVKAGEILRHIQNQARSKHQVGLIEAVKRVGTGKMGMTKFIQSLGILEHDEVTAFGDKLAEAGVVKGSQEETDLLAAGEMRMKALRTLDAESATEEQKATARKEYYSAMDTLGVYGIQDSAEESRKIAGDRPVATPDSKGKVAPGGAAPSTSADAATTAPIKTETNIRITVDTSAGAQLKVTNVAADSRANQGTVNAVVNGAPIRTDTQ